MPVTTVAEFFSYDYASLFPVGSFYSYFAHPAVPFVSVFLYLVLSTPVFTSIAKTLKLEPKGQFLQWFVIIHSAALALYSGWTFINSFSIVSGYFAEHGYWGTICHAEEDLWIKRGLSFWIVHFYISKYYEFIDTWITLLKGRVPIFLQTYHHAGVAIIMWELVVTANPLVIVILCLNSFIHTLMYSYYVFAAFGINSPLKHYLTQMQIGQFLIGLAIAIPSHFYCNHTEAQHFALLTLEVYTVILVGLFGSFYMASYGKKGGAKKKE